MGAGFRIFPRIFRQRTIAAVRVVHVACSMLGVVALGLFAVSGFMLTHGDLFGLDSPGTRTLAAHIPAAAAQEADREKVIRSLRDTLGLKDRVESFEAGEDEILVVFARPAVRTDVTIGRQDGRAQVITERGGLGAFLADLHRGKHTGAAWRWLIDLAAASLLVACVSGIVLWLATPKRRILGLAALAVGILVWVGGYLLMVP